MVNLCAWICLAVQPTTLDKLRRVSTETWVNLALVLIGIFLVVRLWRTLKHVNDYAPYVAAGIVASAVFFYWVYSRTEPAFLTPVVERLAPFFPTRGQQQKNIEQARRARES